MRDRAIRVLPFPPTSYFNREVVDAIKAIPDDKIQYTKEEVAWMERALANLHFMLDDAKNRGGARVLRGFDQARDRRDENLDGGFQFGLLLAHRGRRPVVRLGEFLFLFRGGNSATSSAVTACRRMKLVDPEARRVPATTPRTSPGLRLPRRNSSSSAVETMCSAVRACSCCTGCTPQSRFMRLQTAGTWLKA